MDAIKMVGDGFKRLCAVLVACVIMWYSVITAPCFGVHASSLDGTLDAIGDFLHRVGDYAVSKVLEPLGPVGDLFGVTIMSLADQPINAMKNDDAVVENVDYDLGATIGMTCPIHIGSSSDNSMMTCFTIPTITVSKTLGILHDVDYMPKIRLCRFSGDTFCDVYALLVPYNDGDWPDGDSVVISSSARAENAQTHFDYFWTFKDSNGIAVSRSFYIRIFFEYGDGTVSVISSDSFNTSYFHIIMDFVQPSIYTITLPSDFQIYRNDIPFYYGCYLTDTGGVAPVGNISNTSIKSFPSYKNTYISYDTSYDYLQNYSYPYVVNNYPVYQELPPPSSFLPPEETTTLGTGVIILDPFTLPPDWVQSDVVELETDHYEVPFESMVADPFDYLVSPYTQTSTETVRGAMKTVPISPPTPQYQVFPKSGNVQETAVGFVNLAYTLLTRSGLDYVIGIAVFGLCVSLLVL